MVERDRSQREEVLEEKVRMQTRGDLKPWLIDALRAHGGRASIVEVCKYVWDHHETELRQSGGLFFTWQYDIRWAAMTLRKEGVLTPAEPKSAAPWQLVEAQVELGV
jgi:hypothetical protein